MIYVAYTAGTDVEAFKNEVRQEFPDFEITRSEPLSLSISCHIGRGAVGFACIKKLKYDEL